MFMVFVSVRHLCFNVTLPGYECYITWIHYLRVVAEHAMPQESMLPEWVKVKCVFALLVCCVTETYTLHSMKDTVIYERLEGEQPIKEATLQHLQDFANLGTHALPSVCGSAGVVFDMLQYMSTVNCDARAQTPVACRFLDIALEVKNRQCGFSMLQFTSTGVCEFIIIWRRLVYLIQNTAIYCSAKLQNNQVMVAKCFDDMNIL